MSVPSPDMLVNMALRSRLTVMSRKNRSTLLSHDAEVGMKCMWKRVFLASPACTAGCLCVG